jgi:hypothetical protein
LERPKRRNTRPQRRRHRFSPVQLEALGALFAVLFTLLFFGVLGPDPFAGFRRGSGDAIKSLVTSEEERRAADYIKQTREANIWYKPPTIYTHSARYLTEHFDESFSPGYVREFSDELETVPIPRLVSEQATYSGEAISTSGEVSTTPSRWIADVVPLAGIRYEWVFQLQDPSGKEDHLTAYCRVTTSDKISIHEGMLVAINGVVLAGGQVPQKDGPGLLDVAYMACSAIKLLPSK